MQKFVFSYRTHDIHLTVSLTLLTSTNDLHKLHKRRFQRYCCLNIFYSPPPQGESVMASFYIV